MRLFLKKICLCFVSDKVVDLLRSMDIECQDRHNYLNAALRWTIRVDPQSKAGHPELHKKCGMLFWQGIFGKLDLRLFIVVLTLMIR